MKQAEVLHMLAAQLWSRVILAANRRREMYHEISWKWQVFNWHWLVSILPCKGSAVLSVLQSHSARGMCSFSFSLWATLSVGWMAESPLIKA